MSKTQSNYHLLDREYLIKQNRKLRMELKQITNVKELHQQALIEMNQKYSESQIIPVLIDIIQHGSNMGKIQELNEIIMQLEVKIMVLEKIATQAEENQKETYALLAQELEGLRKEDNRKEEQLHKFYQKIGEVDYISGLVTKYRDIISASELTMSFKKDQQQLLDALNLQQETIKKLTEQKQKLFRINVHMKQEVEKKKDEVRNMTMFFMNDQMNGGGNGQDQVGNTDNILEGLGNQDYQNTQMKSSSNSDQQNNSLVQGTQQHEFNNSLMNNSANMSKLMSLNKMNTSSTGNTTINFIKMQRELIKEVTEEDQANSSCPSSDMDCPQLTILFPDKVQKIIKQKEEVKVPYLNMKKVRQMMTKRQQKMRKQWDQEKNHINPTTKIIQLQTELEITRKELSSQTLKFRLLDDEVKMLRLQVNQLEARNQLLTQSNIKLKNNYQMVYKDYEICKSITTQVERLLGTSVSKENQKVLRGKIGSIIENNNEKNAETSTPLTSKNETGNKLLRVFQIPKRFNNQTSLNNSF